MVTFSTLERMTEVAVPGEERTNHYTDQQQTSLKEALCSSRNTTVGIWLKKKWFFFFTEEWNSLPGRKYCQLFIKLLWTENLHVFCLCWSWKKITMGCEGYKLYRGTFFKKFIFNFCRWVFLFYTCLRTICVRGLLGPEKGVQILWS